MKQMGESGNSWLRGPALPPSIFFVRGFDKVKPYGSLLSFWEESRRSELNLTLLS